MRARATRPPGVRPKSPTKPYLRCESCGYLTPESPCAACLATALEPEKNPPTPQYVFGGAWIVATNLGDEIVFADEVPEHPKAKNFIGHIDGKRIRDFEEVHGWFAQYYYLRTIWAGPFDTEEAAKDWVRETYSVDPETGLPLES